MTPNWEWRQRSGAEWDLVVRGDLDVAIGVEFVDAVEERLQADDAPRRVTVDLSEVEFIDSSGLRALLQLQQNYDDRVRIGTVSAAVQRLLELTGTLEAFHLRESD